MTSRCWSTVSVAIAFAMGNVATFGTDVAEPTGLPLAQAFVEIAASMLEGLDVISCWQVAACTIGQ